MTIYSFAPLSFCTFRRCRYLYWNIVLPKSHDIFDHEEVLPGRPLMHAPHYVNDHFNARYPLWSSQIDNQFFVARTRAAIKLQADPGTNASLYDYTSVWLAHSHGPDRDHDDFLSDQGYPTVYDPSNGTISDGDIFYFGPGTGYYK